jgi:hypothetical protein
MIEVLSLGSLLIGGKLFQMKIVVFWDVAPCSLVDIDKRFREAYCLDRRSELPS